MIHAYPCVPFVVVSSLYYYVQTVLCLSFQSSRSNGRSSIVNVLQVYWLFGVNKDVLPSSLASTSLFCLTSTHHKKKEREGMEMGKLAEETMIERIR